MKTEFSVEDKKFYVVTPSAQNIIKAQKEYAKSFAEALKEGILTRDAIEKQMVLQGVWSEEKQKQRDDLEDFLNKGYETLKLKGGIKKSEAKKLALEMQKKRLELMFLISDKSKYEICSAEGIAERNRLNLLISLCSKNEDGTNIFKDVNDFYDKQEDKVTIEASKTFAKIYLGYNDDIFKDLPESEFLIKYGFMNDKMQMIDSEGNVTEEIGEKIEFKEFLDD